MQELNIRAATAKQLLEYYNAHAAEPVRRFADRPTAERRCRELQATLSFLAAHPVPAEENFMIPTKPYSVGTCPKCGATQDITCGQIRERAGRQEVINEHEAFCHNCGHEFNYETGGPVVRRKRSAPSGRQRPAMSASLRLDRQVLNLENKQVFRNASHVWRTGLISSAQCDRLSALLYGAAKRSEFPVVTVNGIRFQLRNTTQGE